ESRVGSLRGQRAFQAHQLRLAQHIAEMTMRARIHGDASISLLHFDTFRTGRSQSLHDEIEAIRAARIVTDVVEVDGSAQKFALAGHQSFKRQNFRSAAQGNRDRFSAIGDSYDDGALAALFEEVLDRIGEQAGLPQPAENLLKLDAAGDRYRHVDRT